MSEKMTPTQRAEKMVQTMLLGVGNGKSYFEYFLGQIEEVRDEGFSAGAREMQAACVKACQGSHGGNCEIHHCAPRIERMILALPLPAAKGEKV